MSRKQKLWVLFKSTFYISAFTFGGGYVIIPLLKDKFVDDLKWIEEDEILDMISIAQATPGPVAVNASYILGYDMFGRLGAFIALLGTILPPMLIISIVSFFYEAFKTNTYVAGFLLGITAAVCAIILNVVFDLFNKMIKERDIKVIILTIIALILSIFIRMSVIYVILICAAVGVTVGLLQLRGERR